MGLGIYANTTYAEAGLGELGMINSRNKIKRAEKRNRQVFQRERQPKKKHLYRYDDYEF